MKYIAQASHRDEWFDLTKPTTLKNARWMINNHRYAQHKKPYSKCWDDFRIIISRPKKIEIFGVMDGIKTYNIEENRKIFGDELPIC
jgi:hypothetical protein